MRAHSLILAALLPAHWPALCQQSETNAVAAPADQAGWPDISGFLDKKYGFLPIVIPITEPAVGYGAAGGLAFISEPLGGEEGGFSRPNVTMVGGLGTENGSWGAVAGDMRYWLDERLQTLAGVVYSSINLDYYGLGEDSRLADAPLGYNLEPKGGMLQGKYRVGRSRWWGESATHTQPLPSRLIPPMGHPACRSSSRNRMWA